MTRETAHNNPRDDGLLYKINGNAEDGYSVTLWEDGRTYPIAGRDGRNLRVGTTTLWGAHRAGRRLLRQERKRRATYVNVEHRR